MTEEKRDKEAAPLAEPPKEPAKAGVPPIEFVWGETRCSRCQAKLSVDVDREEQLRVLAEEAEKEAAEEGAERGALRVTQTRGKVRYFRCGRCGWTGKGVVKQGEPKKETRPAKQKRG